MNPCSSFRLSSSLISILSHRCYHTYAPSKYTIKHVLLPEMLTIYQMRAKAMSSGEVFVPLRQLLAELRERGIDVRITHAGEGLKSTRGELNEGVVESEIQHGDLGGEHASREVSQSASTSHSFIFTPSQITGIIRRVRRLVHKQTPVSETHRDVVRNYLKAHEDEWMEKQGASFLHQTTSSSVEALERRNQFIAQACAHLIAAFRTNDHLAPIAHDQTHALLESELGKAERQVVTLEHKKFAEQFVQEKAQTTDLHTLSNEIPLLCEEASCTVLPGLPRKQLYFILWHAILKLQRKSARKDSQNTSIMNALAKEYAEAQKKSTQRQTPSRVASSIVELCDRAQKRGVTLPRHTLYSHMKRRINGILRDSVTQEQRDFIEKYVTNLPSKEKDFSQICDHLQVTAQCATIPRDVLRNLVKRSLKTYSKRAEFHFTPEQLELIANYVNDSLTVREWCDQLAVRLPEVPRQVLYVHVRSALNKKRRRRERDNKERIK